MRFISFDLSKITGFIAPLRAIVPGGHLPTMLIQAKKINDINLTTIDVIVVGLTAITTIMASLTAIAMMITLVRTTNILFVDLPTVDTSFMVSLTAITMESVAILGGRMVVFRDFTIL